MRKFEYTPICHFCRKAWNDDARHDALDTIDGIWEARHTGKTGSVKLCHSGDLDGHGFHRRIRLTETDEWKGGMMISDSFRLPMDDVSLEGDSIHGLVSKYMNNQWPIRRRTVLRITAKMGEEVSRGVYVFNRFRNSFWSEPCIELDCGIHGIDEKTCIPVTSIKSLQIIETWNDTMPVVIRNVEFVMEVPHPAIIQVKRGPVMCVDHVWLSSDSVAPIVHVENDTAHIDDITELHAPCLAIGTPALFIEKGWTPADRHDIFARNGRFCHGVRIIGFTESGLPKIHFTIVDDELVTLFFYEVESIRVHQM